MVLFRDMVETSEMESKLREVVIGSCFGGYALYQFLPASLSVSRAPLGQYPYFSMPVYHDVLPQHGPGKVRRLIVHWNLLKSEQRVNLLEVTFPRYFVTVRKILSYITADIKKVSP